MCDGRAGVWVLVLALLLLPMLIAGFKRKKPVSRNTPSRSWEQDAPMAECFDDMTDERNL